MASSEMSVFLENLHVALGQAGGEATDGELLARFVERCEGAALAALVRRHAPMVWGVCRRLLGSHHDAEDAFQATFLVLARKAAAVRDREAVANWLHGVARQTAVRVKAAAARRRTRERQLADLPEPVGDRARPGELLSLVDEELGRLPERFRTLIVLCDLEGMTRKEVARRLGCPEGTVASRLARARDLLARRLARRCPSASGGPLVVLSWGGSASAPAWVVASTVKAVSVAAGEAVSLGLVSPKVVALTEGVLKAMFVSKMKGMTAALLVVGVILGGAGAGSGLLSGPGAAQPAPNPIPVPADRGAEGIRPAEPKDTDPKAPGKKPDSATARVRALLQEKRDILQKLADRAKELEQRGQAGPALVQEATLRVHQADLELCQTTKERVVVMEKIVEVHKALEERMAQLGKRKAVAEGPLLEARVSRLEAEIALEREKAKLAAP
jgi:RNA polymerase sigma factor (sigma-70 family)